MLIGCIAATSSIEAAENRSEECYAPGFPRRAVDGKPRVALRKLFEILSQASRAVCEAGQSMYCIYK
jgi:hypothetical protein